MKIRLSNKTMLLIRGLSSSDVGCHLINFEMHHDALYPQRRSPFLFLADLQTFNPLFISSLHPRGRIHTFKVASSLYSEIVGTLPLYMLWWKYYLHVRNNSNSNRIKKCRVWNPSKGRGVLGAYTPSLGVQHKIIWKRWQLLLSKTSLKICTFVYTYSKP